ncbi:MAG TPA: GNAT family N-acetyltransferase [Candidatus Limnocylindrales bacterium]
MTTPGPADRETRDEHVTKLIDAGEAGPWIPVTGGVEWRRGPYLVSTDPDRLDLAGTAGFLAGTYWAPEIPESVVRRSVQHSIAFGLYEGDRQVGFARVTSDRATFAWIGDVYVAESHRGRGLALWLMRCVLAHPELQELRRWLLASTTARGLYERLGFTALAAPERFMEIADRDVHRRQREREAASGGG